MKNPYAAGFYALLIAVCVICVCLFWTIWTSGNAGSTQDAFAFVNSVAALFQALAAVVVAALAYRGLTTWKQELIHGKALSEIWEASKNFRLIEKRLIHLRITWANGKTVGAGHVREMLANDQITQYLDAFAEHCVVLDRVVVKNEWEWNNRATELRGLIIALAIECQKPLHDDNRNILAVLGTRSAESTQTSIERLEVTMEQIERGLDKLELRYSS